MAATTIPSHAITLRVLDATDLEIDVNDDLALKIEVSCSAGCDLGGEVVSIAAGEELLASSPLITHSKDANTTDEICLKAPDVVGQHTWVITFQGAERQGAVHSASMLPFVFTTLPHPAAIAVWEVPSPVVVGSAFRVKVGAKCEKECRLTGHTVIVQDDAGVTVGTGILGELPWEGTKALHWAEVDLQAPATAQVISWRALMLSESSALAHETAAAGFSFRSTPPPDHRVDVSLVDKVSGTPVEEVEVRLGMHATFSNAEGHATFDVAAGQYELTIRKDGYEAEPIIVDVRDDVDTRVELARGLTKAEWEDKLMEFKHIPWG